MPATGFYCSSNVPAQSPIWATDMCCLPKAFQGLLQICEQQRLWRMRSSAGSSVHLLVAFVIGTIFLMYWPNYHGVYGDEQRSRPESNVYADVGLRMRYSQRPVFSV